MRDHPQTARISILGAEHVAGTRKCWLALKRLHWPTGLASSTRAGQAVLMVATGSGALSLLAIISMVMVGMNMEGAGCI